MINGFYNIKILYTHKDFLFWRLCRYRQNTAAITTLTNTTMAPTTMNGTVKDDSADISEAKQQTQQ